ncbi:hypothetical protein D3C76_1401530 [compost metagenome]
MFQCAYRLFGAGRVVGDVPSRDYSVSHFYQHGQKKASDQLAVLIDGFHIELMRIALNEVKERQWPLTFFTPFLLSDGSTVTELVAISLVPVQLCDNSVQRTRRRAGELLVWRPFFVAGVNRALDGTDKVGFLARRRRVEQLSQVELDEFLHNLMLPENTPGW